MNHKFARQVQGWSLIGVFSLLLVACGGNDDKQSEEQQAPPPKQAQVQTLEPRDLELDKNYPAMVRSDQAVDIVARVDGYLEKQLYQAGDIVEKGQTLFTIEKGPYQAAVEQARADLQSARANYSEAQRDYQRYQRLYQQGSISQQQRDQALNERETSNAAVAQAKAALDSAQIDLNYTDVKSPVSGQVSLNLVNVGNYVAAQTELAEVNPVDPLEVRFSLPQSDAFALRRQRQMDNAPNIGVELNFPYGDDSATTDTTLKGDLNFLGSRVDESTSTVQARAVFANPQGLFLPGQFVRVQLANLMRFHVLAVPEVAVTEGLKGPQVMLVNDKGEAESRFITMGEQSRGWVIVPEGLEAGDKVIVSNIGGISAGDKIDAQPFDGSAEDEPQDPSGIDASGASNAPGQGTSVSGETEQNSADQRSSDN
ncbi:membrane fusion protein, multidrug efflux system [Kushneria avicenniae]|uniref:Membrane fusion protein, multidrug efflux system n=1 Tax=Kushneria avicenniae TaxID=402385 RepID=A0A1I1FCC4_9GAMM|nr:efflux RND transporter periplasmic adaptor subunit [Kushneria avicenniae]SFB96632.1 membrane fusion protein, multidrug efflux system [Kushneria avicenniae]